MPPMPTLETELFPRMPTEANSSQAQARGGDVTTLQSGLQGSAVERPGVRDQGPGVRGQALIPGWQGVPVWLQPMWDAPFSDLRGRTHSRRILKEDASRMEAMES